MLRFLFIISILLFNHVSYAKEIPTLQVEGRNYDAQVFPLQLYKDFSKSLTIDDISKLDLSNNVVSSRFNIPIERANYWFVFNISNKSDNNLRRIIKFDEPFLHYADIYYRESDHDPKTDNSWVSEKNGLAVNLFDRSIHNRLPSFAVDLKAGETKTIYLMATTELNLLTVAVEVKSPYKFSNDEQIATGAYWLFFGISFAMLIYNLFLFAILRDRLYFFYVLYCATFLIFVEMYSGFDLFILPIASMHYFLIVYISISVAAVLQFIRELLQTKKNLPRIDFISRCLIGLFLIQGLMTLIDMNYYYLVFFITIPSTIFLFITILIAYLQKIPLANYALFGLSWYVLGIFAIAAVNAGLAPYNIFTRYGFMVGSLIELFVFSLALAYRVHHLQISETAMQIDLYRAESNAKQKLEATVKSRTAELIEANQKLEHLSQVDGLTGLFNRRYFDTALNREWLRLKRQELPLCLILADLDFFKQFNDIYGHQGGDQCLRIVGEVVKKNISRSTDVAARYGGEEFVLLLPETSVEAGREIANKIRQTLKQKSIKHIYNPKRIVTMSFGVAEFVPNNNCSIEMLIKNADLALYESKNKGRDRVTIFGQ